MRAKWMWRMIGMIGFALALSACHQNGTVFAVDTTDDTVDVNPGDGGFIGVPGSHKANQPFKPEPDSHLVVQPTLKAGDMLIFTEALMHGTRKWVSPNRRRSLLYKYSPGYSTWGAADTGSHFLDMAQTDIERALLRPPFVGHREALPFPPLD